MNAMAALIRAVKRSPVSSRPVGQIQPQYLPALAQSALLRLRVAHKP